MVRGIGRRAFLGLLGAAPLAWSGETVTAGLLGPGESDGESASAAATTVTWGSVQRDATRQGFEADVGDEPRDGFEKVWSATLNGSMQYGPVHRDGRVFVGTDEELVALDGSDGSEIWQNGTAVATGLAVTESAVLASDTAFLYALDPADGSTIWTQEYGTQTFVYHPWEDLVFSTYGRANEVSDGTILWETDVSPRSRYELPAADGSQIYLTKVEDVHAIDASNGEKQWETETGETLTRPTVHDGLDMIFTGAMHSADVYAFDSTDGSLAWQTNTGASDENPPSVAVTGNTVFVSNYESVTALSTTDGSTIWTYATESVDTAPIVLGNTVYVGGRGGDENALGLIALDAASGEELAHFGDPDTVEGVPFRTPCAVGGDPGDPTLFGGDSTVFAVRAGDGGGGGGGTPQLDLSMTDDTATAGGIAEIDVTVSNPGTAESTGIDVLIYVPTDAWQLVNEPEEVDTVAAGASETRTLRVSVPDDADGTYDLAGVAEDSHGNSARAEATVTIRGRSVSLDLAGGSAPVGGSVRVEATLENTGEVDTGGLRLDFGDPLNGWERTLVDAAGGTPSTSSGEDEASVTSVAWDGLGPGEAVTPAYDLDVPATAERGTYSVEAAVISRRAAAVDGTDPIARDTATVEITPGTVSLGFAEGSARPVQVVENTRVDADIQHDSIPDPDMVAGRPTAVLFGPDGDGIDRLSADRSIGVSVAVDGADVGPLEYTLTGEELQSLAGTTGLDQAREFANLAAEVPVFEMPADPDEITVTVGNGADTDGADGGEGGDGGGGGGGGREQPTLESASTTLTAGADFAVHDQPELVMGFIEISDPEGGDNYAGVDGDGRVGRYEDCYEIATDYIKRVYPVDPDDVFRIAHYEPVEGTTESGATERDFKEAYDALTEYARDIHGVELDVAIAFVPGRERDENGRIAGGDSYFDYHGQSGTVGAERTGPSEQPQTVAAVEAQHIIDDGSAVVNAADVGATAAHEAGHHFLPAYDPEDHSGDTATFGDNSDRPLYPDPLAQRRDSGAGDPLDNSHARDELVSVGYDLRDGFGLPELGVRPRPSFMSYADIEPHWADAYSYRRLREGGFEPQPGVESGFLETVISGIAVLADDGLEIESTRRRQGYAQPGNDTGEIALDLADPTGETIDSRRVSAWQTDVHGRHADGQSGEQRVVFTIPFPAETQTLRARDEATEATAELSLVDVTIAEALRRLPDRAFETDPDDRRETLLETAATATNALDANRYRRARTAVAELETRIDEWVTADYGAAANQPTTDDLRDLVADLRERLKRLDEVATPRATPTEMETETADSPTESTAPDAATPTGVSTETTHGDGSLPGWVLGAGVTGGGLAVWLRDRLGSGDDE